MRRSSISFRVIACLCTAMHALASRPGCLPAQKQDNQLHFLPISITFGKSVPRLATACTVSGDDSTTTRR